jgi:hypothetical protein
MIASRIGCNLPIQFVDHPVDELPLFRTERGTLADRLFRLPASATAILTKFLSHRRPNANHFDQVHFRHVIGVSVELRVVPVRCDVVMNGQLHSLRHAVGVLN